MKPEKASPPSFSEIIFQRFRVAAKGHGNYCPIKNELLVRKGRKTYRIICEKYVIRLKASGCSEYRLPIPDDVKVHEFRRIIAWMTDTRDGMDSGKKTTEP